MTASKFKIAALVVATAMGVGMKSCTCRGRMPFRFR